MELFRYVGLYYYNVKSLLLKTVFSFAVK